MKKLQPPEERYPLFPSNPPLKIEILSSPTFSKIWWETHHPPPLPPLPPPPSERGGVHTMITQMVLNNTSKVA